MIDFGFIIGAFVPCDHILSPLGPASFAYRRMLIRTTYKTTPAGQWPARLHDGSRASANNAVEATRPLRAPE